MAACAAQVPPVHDLMHLHISHELRVMIMHSVAHSLPSSLHPAADLTVAMLSMHACTAVPKTPLVGLAMLQCGEIWL